MPIAEIIVRILEGVIKTLRRRSTKDNFQRIVSIYEAMRRLVNEANVERVLILKMEDGGGKIKPGVNIYASAIHEDYNARKFKPCKFDYQRILLDKSYTSLLSTLVIDEYADVFTSKLEEGLIKSQYQSDGIVYSEWYLIHATKKAIYLCSLSTTNHDDTFDGPHQRHTINVQVNTIKNSISGRRLKT